MFDIDKELSEIGRQTVLCVGDLMLDEFVYGEVSRISPEAPAPVIAASRSEIVVGGAGNVARNIASLGAKCIFVGVIGADDAAQNVRIAWKDQRQIEARLIVDAARPTTRKVRFVSEHFSTHLLRADWERAGPLDAAQEQAVIDNALEALPHVGAVVLSDYAKGVLTPRVIREIIVAARAARVPVVVDPKGHDYTIYRGCTIITPNRQELNAAMRTPDALDDAKIALSALSLLKAVDSEAVLVTRSESGMTLVATHGEPVHVPSYPVKVRDVSGAGDTVVAVIATMLAARAGFVPAMRAANAAAAVAVSKRGTAAVSVSELRTQILPAASLAAEQKIFFDWAMLDERLAEWRRQGLRIGFTNGCFDLLHPGHIKVLTEARAACDRLVVGLNSDASVKRLKGESRPVQEEHARAQVLAALSAVDLVAVFEQDTPLDLIRHVRPRTLIKGGDYSLDTVVGRDIVEADGGEVVLVALAPGFSTTALVRRSHEPGK